MNKVAVIGGGASGLSAAVSAAAAGKSVVLFEKNEKLGKKIYITGKGRCNITNNVLPQDFLANVVTNPKFLFGAVNVFSPVDTIEFLRENGCETKTERGNRVFPVSDKASDVTKAFEKALKKSGVKICLNTEIQDITTENGAVKGVVVGGSFLPFDSVIVCTGGASYPLTGSTGDGYRFAKITGHTVVELKPSLVGIELLGADYKPLQGLSLKNVSVSVKDKEKTVYSDFGEMLFTHFGVSGPIILSASCNINKKPCKGYTLSVDLKPALTEKQLDDRLLREIDTGKNKTVSVLMRSLLPATLTALVTLRAGVSAKKKACTVTKEERLSIIKSLKSLDFIIHGLRPLEEAIVTSGGVSVKDIDPKTMQSKKIKGLFFAGEVIDVDAYTGGFNLQIALSTGFVAGKNA